MEEPQGPTVSPGGAEPSATFLPSLEEWARSTAGRLLAELPRRWAHSQGVARKAEDVALALEPADRPMLIAAAWLHDIGYAAVLRKCGLHPLDGARYLAALGVPGRVCGLVAHHSGAASVAALMGLGHQLAEFPDERGPVRDALWYCDLTTSPDGLPVSLRTRTVELCARRGPDDPVVRALADNGAERAGAVRRTESLLCPVLSGQNRDSGHGRRNG
ncbi:HD domain-containing protein [Kutzneria buriramensis]|uniref:Putative nucleotidyltransferase with HDIG domain n=1 Tax=Kutzneria buriramensis TaxID=1045776 RepID=A0A3E0GYT9_9PSEU|nr:HD domain-containing protein [Kutzneria buriramensis]REH34915.1 putative nucleotidyltransferase with HDIG domain [Kutzneria buriramensis]